MQDRQVGRAAQARPVDLTRTTDEQLVFAARQYAAQISAEGGSRARQADARVAVVSKKRNGDDRTIVAASVAAAPSLTGAAAARAAHWRTHTSAPPGPACGQCTSGSPNAAFAWYSRQPTVSPTTSPLTPG